MPAPVFLLPNLTCCLFTAFIFVQISAAVSLHLTVHLDHCDVFTLLLFNVAKSDNCKVKLYESPVIFM